MYVYEQTEACLWTVGHYDPQGKWHSESDHDTKEKAAQRVHWLNGAYSQYVSETFTLPEIPSVLPEVP